MMNECPGCGLTPGDLPDVWDGDEDLEAEVFQQHVDMCWTGSPTDTAVRRFTHQKETE